MRRPSRLLASLILFIALASFQNCTGFQSIEPAIQPVALTLPAISQEPPPVPPTAVELPAETLGVCEITTGACHQYPSVSNQTFVDTMAGANRSAATCLPRAKDFAQWCATAVPVKASFKKDGVVVAEKTFDQVSAGEPIEGYDIVVVAGQSNAQGIGRGSYTDPLKMPVIDGQIFQLGRYNSDTNCPASDLSHDPKRHRQIIAASDTLDHWGSCLVYNAVGFGMSFARRWVNNELRYGRRVLIVPAAWGGTASAQWIGHDRSIDQFVASGPGSRDGYMSVTGESLPKNFLWKDLKERVGLLLADKSKQNRVIGLLWSQGEADLVFCTGNPGGDNCAYGTQAAVAEQWRERILGLFRDFRASFDPDAKAPILAMGYTQTMQIWKMNGATIDFATPRVAFETQLVKIESDGLLANYGFVSTLGMLSNADIGSIFSSSENDYDEAHVHYSAPAQIEAGQRFYQRSLQIKK